MTTVGDYMNGDADIGKFLSLEETLTNTGNFETVSDMVKRRYSLTALQKITNTWLQKEAVRKGVRFLLYKARFLIIGSCRLGVTLKDSDMDIVFVAPQWISEYDFLNSFYHELMDKVECLITVNEQYGYMCKILRVKMLNGYRFDILFASVPDDNVPRGYKVPEKDSDLIFASCSSSISIGAVLTTSYMLNMVYSRRVFRTALKAIRLWAKSHDVYSGPLGYFNGVSLALMTFRICQLYPKESAGVIVYHFFRIYSQWEWENPIRICSYLSDFDELENSNCSMYVFTACKWIKNALKNVEPQGSKIISFAIKKDLNSLSICLKII
ncbi:unnamed protein product [Hymenolepis diminuta]|uniref:polynucleotide adenylyltransferase n=1 Tax=Hymenolepis diminuta TaxID=6216 RepID=A0A564YIB8_HYMDI|nr:unnamed protein product [Hymenolepis diminuta]